MLKAKHMQLTLSVLFFLVRTDRQNAMHESQPSIQNSQQPALKHSLTFPCSFSLTFPDWWEVTGPNPQCGWLDWYCPLTLVVTRLRGRPLMIWCAEGKSEINYSILSSFWLWFGVLLISGAQCLDSYRHHLPEHLSLPLTFKECVLPLEPSGLVNCFIKALCSWQFCVISVRFRNKGSVFFSGVCAFLPRSLLPFGKISDSKRTIYFEWPNKF